MLKKKVKEEIKKLKFLSFEESISEKCINYMSPYSR